MTWNFPTWQCSDGFPAQATRNSVGGCWCLGPGSETPGTTSPFTTSITGVFSVLIRDGWTSQDGVSQSLFSIGNRSSGFSNGACGLHISLDNSNTTPQIRIRMQNSLVPATIYDVLLGDEDGSSWMSVDKWYQIGFSADASSINYIVNGTTSPKATESVINPGALSLDADDERIWVLCSKANQNFVSTQNNTLAAEFPSFVIGPSMWLATTTDFSNSTVSNRIFDTDGNFRNPGEDGSLWWGDEYSDTLANFYFPAGVPWPAKGSDGQTWTANGGATGSGQMYGGFGGLRKNYE